MSLLAAGCFAAELSNTLFIYADDLGYGDVGCYNPESKALTPNLNQMAADGMRFTDAHSPSTVCTPSRYGEMTGRMPFRLNYKDVFTGVEGPCLITADRLTLPEMLRQQSYTTAMFGKWHIGLTFLDTDGRPVHETGKKTGIELVRLVGDEIYLIKPGANYGWPIITYGKNYNGTPITDIVRKEGMEQPVWYWRPSTAVSAIDFYRGELFPKWNNKLLVAALKYEDLRVLDIEQGRVMHEAVILKNAGRVRDVVCGPDGAIYVVLNSPDIILRLTPKSH